MAKSVSGSSAHTSVHKKTNQGGGRPKTSSMNKTQKNNFKKYRGQGR